MKSVSRFEAELLRILQCFLGRVPLGQALPLIVNERSRPKCLSRNCVELAEDSLRKGCVSLLAHGGGWAKERFMRGEVAKEGRLWQRTPPSELGLGFSGQTLEFLLWITAAKPTEKKKYPLQLEKSELTLGDQFLLFLAYEALQNTEVTPILEQYAVFSSHPLIWLFYPDQMLHHQRASTPSFQPWLTAKGACILEAWQSKLVERWFQLEESKGTIIHWQRMVQFGQIQTKVLESFCQQAENANRRDLARFLLVVASRLLPEGTRSTWWTGTLDVQGLRVADRMDCYRAAASFLHHFENLRAWRTAARDTSYLDDGYEASQLWLRDWERWQGDLLSSRSQAVLRELEPLRA